MLNISRTRVSQTNTTQIETPYTNIHGVVRIWLLSVTLMAVISHFDMTPLSSDCSTNDFQDIKNVLVLTDSFEVHSRLTLFGFF